VLWNDGILENDAEFGMSGFIALPSGSRLNSSGGFFDLGNYAFFWSATEYDASQAWYRFLRYSGTSAVNRSNFSKNMGYSVRCIKD